MHTAAYNTTRCANYLASRALRALRALRCARELETRL